MKLQQRYYQDEARAASMQAYKEGIHQQLFVMATGTGKTVLFSELIKDYRAVLPGAKFLVFAHREELVDQAVEAIKRSNPLLQVGKEMSSHWADTACDVVVSCVASIGRDGSKRLLRFGEFDVVICDEAHHSIATTYMNVFEQTGVLKPDTKKLLIGFTATPKRKNLTKKQKQMGMTLDEENILSLKSVYKKIVYTYPIRRAIKDGWLVPLKGFRLKTDIDLSEVKTVAGDFQQDQLSSTVNTPHRNAQIVKMYQEHCAGKKFIAFSVDIEHAQDIALMFQTNGINAQAIWGNDPDRQEKKDKHKNGEIKGLINAQLLTEGYDDWSIGCVILCAPTRNPSKYTQQVGRVTRLQEGTGNLRDYYAMRDIAFGSHIDIKHDAYVLDIVDNSKKCSLVTLPSLLGLNPDLDLKGQDVCKVADELDELQDKYPGIDFTMLVDLSKVKSYIESIDLFAEPYTEEVKEFSTLTWMAVQDGSYVLSIPERRELKDTKAFARFLHEKLHIKMNELDEWELSITTVDTDRKLGTFNSLQEAFTTADDVIRRCRPDRLKVMERNAEWHKYPASEPAKKLLRQRSKNKPIPYCLCTGQGTSGSLCPTCQKPRGITAGQASAAINILAAKK